MNPLMTILITTLVLVHGVIAKEGKHVCDRMCICGLRPMVCEYDLQVTAYISTKVDGSPRKTHAFNNQVPGPLITACEGDTIEVNVTNMILTENITVHWHGLPQRGTPEMDGVYTVTEYGISPNSYFVYKFRADVVGAHMYHGHSGVFRCHGANGPLIIGKCNSEYNNLEKIILMLGDFTDRRTGLAVNTFINGRGRNPTSKSESLDQFTEITVRPNSTYLIHIINAMCSKCVGEISIDQHIMTVIESDGHCVESSLVGGILISPGERYTALLETKDSNKKFLIRHRALVAECVTQFAVMTYCNGADEEQELGSTFTSDLPLLGVQFNALEKASKDCSPDKRIFDATSCSVDKSCGNADHTYYLHSNVGFSSGKLVYGLSGISNKLSDDVVLLDAFKGNNSKSYGFCTADNVHNHFPKCDHLLTKCVHVIEIPGCGKCVELVIVNKLLDIHPFHLHGHAMKLIGSGHLTEKVHKIISSKEAKGSLPRRSGDSSVMKDIFVLGPESYIILRFTADNPGVWFFHCHLQEHSELGMALSFATCTKELRDKSYT